MSSCVECGAGGPDTQIHQHHISYERDETVALCVPCHRLIHHRPDHRLYPEDERPADSAQVSMPDEVRDDLRRYKAEYGDTYGQAVRRLLATAGWIDEDDAPAE